MGNTVVRRPRHIEAIPGVGQEATILLQIRARLTLPVPQKTWRIGTGEIFERALTDRHNNIQNELDSLVKSPQLFNLEK